MNCAEMENKLGSYLDGELSGTDRTGVEEHVASCGECRQVLEGLQSQDRNLETAFSTRQEGEEALAERVIAAVHREAAPAAEPGAKIIWFPSLVAAAAGFLVAFLFFEIDWTGEPGRKESEILCRLQVATGAVEVKNVSGDSWNPLATGGEIQPGSWVRTPKTSKCSFTYEDGTEVKLNGDTEARLVDLRKIELKRGQIFTNVSPSEVRFEVRTDQARIEALGTTLDISHLLGEEKRITTLAVLDGAARMGGERVEAGEICRVINGKVESPRRVREMMLLTKWVHSILVLRKGDNPELEKRLNDLLVEIGQTKMEHLYEAEIRAMGDRCALPLARYIESDVSKKSQRRRRKAARILADIATKEYLGNLASLLRDSDPEVRVQMGRGLERVTGTNLGMDKGHWSAFTCNTEDGASKWEKYLGRPELPWGAE